MVKGYLGIVIAACLWGVIGPISRLAFQQGLEPLEVAFWRAVLAWLCFALHAGCRREIKIESKDILPVCVFGLGGVTFFYGAYQLAVAKGGAALAAVLLYTAPAWVVMMAAFFLREAVTLPKIGALALTLVGVMGVSLGAGQEALVAGGGLDLMALLCGLVAGFCYALYYLFGKYFAGRYSSPNLFLYILPIGALGLYPWVQFQTKNSTAWCALFVLSVVCTYGAYYAYYHSLRYLEASRASIIATVEPVVAAVVAYVWWHEKFNWAGYLGSGLILSAVVLVVLEKGPKLKKSS